MRGDVAHERGAGRSFGVEPAEFVGERVPALEDLL